MRYAVTVPDREYFDQNIPCRTPAPSTRSAGGTCRPSGSRGMKRRTFWPARPIRLPMCWGASARTPAKTTAGAARSTSPSPSARSSATPPIGTTWAPATTRPARACRPRRKREKKYRHCGSGRVRPDLRARPGAAGLLGGSLRVGAGPGRHALPGHSPLPASARNHQDGSRQHPGDGGHAAHARDARARHFLLPICARNSMRCCWPPGSTRAAS